MKVVFISESSFVNFVLGMWMLFEFKLNGSVEEALLQIDEKGYLIPFQADERRLIKVGASFSADERNLAGWEVKWQ